MVLNDKNSSTTSFRNGGGFQSVLSQWKAKDENKLSQSEMSTKQKKPQRSTSSAAFRAMKQAASFRSHMEKAPPMQQPPEQPRGPEQSSKRNLMANMKTSDGKAGFLVASSRRLRLAKSYSRIFSPRKVKSLICTTHSFEQRYELGDELGAGAFALVREAVDRETRDTYAVKIVQKKQLSSQDEQALCEEIDVLTQLKHKNIIRLYSVFQSPTQTFLVTEKMMGGELLDRVVQKEYYSEREARDSCLAIFDALAYCHSHGIAHRDLKPENLLLLSEDNDCDIKLADFGLAKRIPTDDSAPGLLTMCGSPSYVAPEIINGQYYNTQVDLWSCGVICYILLGGYAPFEDSDQKLLFETISAGDYEFHDEFWSYVSESAQDFIKQLLTVDPTERLTAKQALKHPWMKTRGKDLEKVDLGQTLGKLQLFNAKRKFRAVVNTVLATQRLSSLLEE